MARSIGIQTDRMKILGLVLSNGLIGLSGALIAQNDGYADVSKGTGVIVIGLASLIIGCLLYTSPGFGEDSPMYYGEVTYRNGNGDWIKKQIKTPVGDYGRYYDAVYETLKNGAPQLVRCV